MKETEIHKKVKPLIEQNFGKIYRIESITSPGFPDSVILINSKVILMEYKLLINNDVYMRPAQYNFALEIEKTKNNYYLLAQSPINKNYYLLTGFSKLNIAKRGNKKYVIINIDDNNIKQISPENALMEIVNG